VTTTAPVDLKDFCGAALGPRGEVTVSMVGDIDLCSSLGLQACLAGALDHPSARP
jgi:hypothetical protein